MVIEKTNFLNEIFLDYQKDKSRDNYCLYRWCTTCGNCKIRDELFLNSIQELGVEFENTGMKKGFCSLSNIRDKELHQKIIKLLGQKLSDLNHSEIDSMLGPVPFYRLNYHKDDFLKFIIMEMWCSLDIRTTGRTKALDDFKSFIQNKYIHSIIDHMDNRYTRNVLNN